MDIRKLQRAIVDGLEDVKAQNVVVFNTEHLTPLFERVIVASGASNRQTKALANSVRDTVKSRGMEVLRTEGEENGEWIIVDCGAAVVHVMQPAIRDYYHLEELWGDKPVRMKIDHAPVKLVKAEPQRAVREVREEAPGKAASRKAAPRKVAPGKSAPRKPASAGAGGARQPLAQAAPARQRTLAGGTKPAPRKPVAAKRPARAGAKAPIKTVTRGAPKATPKSGTRGAAGAGKGGAKPAPKGVKKR
jgi:ribosome-associated protein